MNGFELIAFMVVILIALGLWRAFCKWWYRD